MLQRSFSISDYYYYLGLNIHLQDIILSIKIAYIQLSTIYGFHP